MKESLQSERFLQISQAAFVISGCQQGSKFDRNRRSSKIKNFEVKHSEKTSVERSCLIKTRRDDKPHPGSNSFVKPTKLKFTVTVDPKTPIQLSSQGQTRGKQPVEECPKN